MKDCLLVDDVDVYVLLKAMMQIKLDDVGEGNDWSSRFVDD